MKRFISRIRHSLWRLRGELDRVLQNGLFPFVNVYECAQVYGGPEEGGWWFITGAPVYSTRAPFFMARKLSNTLYARYNEDMAPPCWYPHYAGNDWGTDDNAGDWGGEIGVYIEDHKAQDFPEYRPTYC